ncbi:hypothetical protein DFQ29_003355 [Apophysomyces sp. BC1021]|nr:hypothetical protein DFQ29_003355 [Apophysomyces sp. BC1021]
MVRLSSIDVGVDTLKEIKPDVDPTAFITLTQPTLLPESRIATSHDTKEEVRLDGSSDEEVWAGLERAKGRRQQMKNSSITTENQESCKHQCKDRVRCAHECCKYFPAETKRKHMQDALSVAAKRPKPGESQMKQVNPVSKVTDFTKHSQVEESEAGPIGNRSVIILDDTQSQPSVLSADLWGDSDMVDQFLLGIVDSIDSEWPAKINAIPSGDADDGELSVPQRLEDPLDVLWDNAGNFAFQAFDSVGHNNHRVSPISPRNDNSQAVVETNDFRQWLEENVVVVYTENGADDV